jgi:hypothetical protein
MKKRAPYKLDGFVDQAIDFEVNQGYQQRQEALLAELWKRIYSGPFPGRGLSFKSADALTKGHPKAIMSPEFHPNPADVHPTGEGSELTGSNSELAHRVNHLGCQIDQLLAALKSIYISMGWKTLQGLSGRTFLSLRPNEGFSP